MRYMIEPVGAQFSNKEVAALAQRFTSRAAEGYRLHSVFHVSQPGCLGLGQGTTTYLAVYVSEDQTVARWLGSTGMVTVQLVSERTGKPASGYKVALEIPDGFTSSHETNNHGEAHFEIRPTDGKVYVSGTVRHSGYLRGRLVIYV